MRCVLVTTLVSNPSKLPIEAAYISVGAPTPMHSLGHVAVFYIFAYDLILLFHKLRVSPICSVIPILPRVDLTEKLIPRWIDFAYLHFLGW